MQFISGLDARPHVVFLSDYDMIMTEHLVQGVDLWINTPRRPWEACGTSGMKILVNGGLNLSELDGWWSEAYAPEVGWAIGDRKEHDASFDGAEASALYDLLEKEVIPEFYTRNAKQIPITWVSKIRESMARLTARFSSNRAVREYTEKFYLTAAESYKKRAENNGALARQIVDWRTSVEENWNRLRFGEVKITKDKDHRRFEVQVYLNHLDRKAVKIELYSDTLTKELDYQEPISGAFNGHIYRGEVPASDPLSTFTARILPYYPGIAIPLELPLIVWQR